MLKTDDEADDHQDIRAIFPNKARLTPLSIMVCDTISWTLLKVLFDPRLDMI